MIVEDLLYFPEIVGGRRDYSPNSEDGFSHISRNVLGGGEVDDVLNHLGALELAVGVRMA